MPFSRNKDDSKDRESTHEMILLNCIRNLMLEARTIEKDDWDHYSPYKISTNEAKLDTLFMILNEYIGGMNEDLYIYDMPTSADAVEMNRKEREKTKKNEEANE